MDNFTNGRQESSTRASTLLSMAGLLIGVACLAGWLTGTGALKSFLSDGATMKANTALLIISSSLSLLLLQFKSAWPSQLFILPVIFFSLLVLAEHFLQTDLKVDQLFLSDHDTNPLLEAPGRTSVLTAFNMLLLSGGIFLSSLRKYNAAQLLAAVAFLLVYASLLGHLFGERGFYRMGLYSGMAFNTALALLVSCSAVLLYDLRKGWLGVLQRRFAGRSRRVYLLAYFLGALPVLIALYLFAVKRVQLSPSSNILILLIITAVMSLPVAYLLLSYLDLLDSDLKASNEQLTIALQASGMGVWDMDLASGVIKQSAKLAEITELPYTNEIMVASLFMLLHPDDAALMQQAIVASVQSGKINIQVRVCRSDQPLRWLQVYGQLKAADSGKAHRLLGTMTDITARKELERHKDEFISTVSHELKTPITSIKAQAQLLERKFSKAGDAATALMLQRINLQITRLSTLIRDLMEVGRIDEHKLAVQKEAYSFCDMVKETVEEVGRTTQTHQLIIGNNPPVSCLGDRGRTGQVLSNLLTNAIKYSPGESRVLVEVQQTPSQLICSVQDFGLGIDQEKQAHLFERFYRAAGDSGSMISGFGLGLYISCEIVRRLGGKIWLMSKKGEGSTFYFSVPLAGG